MNSLLARAALVGLGFLAGCGSNGKTQAGSAATGSAVVCGTVLVAATGEPAANVRIEGPHGRSTKSDKQGRFELKDLGVGTCGELCAKDDSGRVASLQLRPLAAGRLEVVLQLTAR
ncbi:MAG: hypothetical protein JNL28_03130 [Planctomycetes bacterium]|nr:hypothetical protein [Planctomycetota bacterium]